MKVIKVRKKQNVVEREEPKSNNVIFGKPDDSIGVETIIIDSDNVAVPTELVEIVSVKEE